MSRLQARSAGEGTDVLANAITKPPTPDGRRARDGDLDRNRVFRATHWLRRCGQPAGSQRARAQIARRRAHPLHRVGGRVHRAWPRTGKAPRALGQDTTALDQSIASWANITSAQNQGPLQSDKTAPLAQFALPTGFVWYGTPHSVTATVKGNSLNVTLDGAQAINIPSLTAASTTAIKYSYGVTTTITPPTAGSYGLRSWGSGLVSLQQMTVGPAS